ncbi:hypothetical protein PLICRDRAFT_173808 [Plicaturopsis crispa FD-325 SS-3]|nr:hypothetical protein PLICRDRAFT_173808 [Plicaturopsis crispa FD-325 SS-3]
MSIALPKVLAVSDIAYDYTAQHNLHSAVVICIDSAAPSVPVRNLMTLIVPRVLSTQKQDVAAVEKALARTEYISSQGDGFVPFLGRYTHAGVPTLVIPYSTYDRLIPFISRNPTRGFDLIRELTDTLASLHDKGIIYSGIRPEDILVDGNGRLLILASNDVPLPPCPPQARLGYRTKRALTEDDYVPTQVDDVYALLCLLYEVIVGKPFVAPSRCTPSVVRMVFKEGYDGLCKPSSIPDDLWTMMRVGWDAPPTAALSMTSVQNLVRSLELK